MPDFNELFLEAFERDKADQKEKEAQAEADASKLKLQHDDYGRIVFESKLDSCF